MSLIATYGIHHMSPRAFVMDVLPVTLSEVTKGEDRFMGQHARSLNCTMAPRGPSVQGLRTAPPTYILK
jgi:hypothetical protein